MIDSILTVCTGNICRSPFAEEILRTKLSGVCLGSAGIGALVGEPADPLAIQVGGELGYDLQGHVARQIGGEHLRGCDLVLVMDDTHLGWIRTQFPEARGKVFLLGHWDGGAEVEDPYRHDEDFFRSVFRKIQDYSESWIGRLS
ncbi:protein tyrosine phosphatase [Salinisphaera sp. PC39]|uniref:low molecular weight protein-tyrosine-phosphatase n=1 Tax=Salinisphaera sp. PC39 TaxID=1304156 RepID=UPI003342D7DA